MCMERLIEVHAIPMVIYRICKLLQMAPTIDETLTIVNNSDQHETKNSTKK